MSAAAFVGLIALAWVVLIAVIVAIFHAGKWIDNAIEEECNAIAPAPCGLERKGER